METITSAVRSQCARAPEAKALVHGSATLNYAMLASESMALAGRIREQLVDRAVGRLAIVPVQHPRTLVLTLAAELAELDVVLLPLGTSRQRAAELARIIPGTAWVDTGEEQLDLQLPEHTGRSADGSVYLFTSGTTGAPKCARHTWASLSANIRTSARARAATWMTGYSLYSYSGLQVWLQVLDAGGCLVVPPDFSGPTGVGCLTECRVDYLNGTPTYLRGLLLHGTAQDWRAVTLRSITIGGEIVDQALLDALAAALPSTSIIHVYGSTEVGPLIVTRDGRAGFDASLLDGERFAIRDGELWIRRQQASMSGYLAGAGSGTWQPLAGWYRSGDLVEQRGDRVAFLGRVDDVINVAGFKVHPAVVEAVIGAVPGVLDVRVHGRQSSLAGALVEAELHVDPTTNRRALTQQIREACSSALPAPMVPRLFRFSEDELPRTAAQKARREL